jgi:hypothetical protein
MAGSAPFQPSLHASLKIGADAADDWNRMLDPRRDSYYAVRRAPVGRQRPADGTPVPTQFEASHFFASSSPPAAPFCIQLRASFKSAGTPRPRAYKTPRLYWAVEFP